MDIWTILAPYVERGPIVLMAATIVIGFVTGWLVSKTTHEREIAAHKETKALLKEAVNGWKAQTKATEKANRLVQRIVDALRLREILREEDPEL